MQPDVSPTSSEPWGPIGRIILRVLATASLVLVVALKSPPIWEDGNYLNASMFTMDTLMVQIFWIFLVVIQGLYLCYSSRSVQQLACVLPYFDTHYIVHNLLHVAFVTFAGRSEFRLAEVVLVLDFFQLLFLYVRHSSGLRLAHWITGRMNRPANPIINLQWDHASVVSGPLSWVVVALFWNGAMMIPQREGLVASILGNICIWVICGAGAFCGIVYKDYTVTMCLSFLSAAIGVGQYRLMDGSSHQEHAIELVPLVIQCSFAFVIMTWLFVFTLALLFTGWLDRRRKLEGEQGEEERTQRQSGPASDKPATGVEVAPVEPKKG